eukprot:FR737167.1.p3 GENE.FR737167.1~~FR737167.1.p3  ORF type:complete len:104 (-),score=22.77 FR737167.1:656-967(-)
MFPGLGYLWGEWGSGITFSPPGTSLGPDFPQGAQLPLLKRETKTGGPTRGAALIKKCGSPGLGPGLQFTGAAFDYSLMILIYLYYLCVVKKTLATFRIHVGIC